MLGQNVLIKKLKSFEKLVKRVSLQKSKNGKIIYRIDEVRKSNS
mgnify:CR=1 FL=1